MISYLKTTDLPQIYQIAQSSYPPELFESIESVTSKLLTYPNGCLGFYVNNSLVAYMLSYPHKGDYPHLSNIISPLPDYDYYWIHDTCILPNHRLQGIGSQFLNLAISNALSLNLNYIKIAAISPAITFWLKQGFILTPTYLKEYDGYIMQKSTRNIPPTPQKKIFTC